VAAALVLAVSITVPKGCSLSAAVRGRATDLDVLANELPRLHANLFATMPEAQYRQALEELRQRAGSMDDEQFFVAVRQLLARVGDPNTTVSLPGEHPLQRRFPIVLQAFLEGVYVTGATHDREDLLGCRLLSIDGMLAAEAMKRTATLVSTGVSQGRAGAVSAAVLSSPAVLYGLGIAGRKDAATFVFEPAGVSAGAGQGGERTVVLEAITQQGTGWKMAGPSTLTRPAGGVALWWEYDTARKALYVNSATFRDDQGTAIGALKVLLDSRPIERVVVDIRRNPGAEAAEKFPLVELLAGRDDVRARWGGGSGASGGNSGDSGSGAAGWLTVLVGQQTAGSAVRQAVEFRWQTDAVFWGEESGGRLSYFGDLRAEQLPHSGWFVQYPTRYFEAVAGDNQARFEPDVVMRQTAADFFAGRDTVLEAVLGAGGRGK
jgi:hypothetical protein